jgi:hypothetical protein
MKERALADDGADFWCIPLWDILPVPYAYQAGRLVVLRLRFYPSA